MALHTGYRCSNCDARYAPSNDRARYRCDACGGILELGVDADRVKAEGAVDTAVDSLWRYRALLPVPPPEGHVGPLAEVGWTPLFQAPRAAARCGVAKVWIKDDGRLPSGSLKDRASAIVVQRAIELGVETIITASTGNAGVALACMANAAGRRAVVLVPKTAPRAKIAQLMVFGAELYLVDGNYDAAFALSQQAAEELGWYCRNTAQNPYTAEGKKTVSFEICEQLAEKPGRFRAPDRIFVSVGDGNIIAGVHKGLRDLHALGLIDRMPRIMGVQAEGSAAVARAFDSGANEVAPVEAQTIADSIAADAPADPLRALAAARATDGAYLTVSDAAIERAIVDLARDSSVFAEPAAAAAYAGACQAAEAGLLGADEEVVVLVTGNGLKDVAAAIRATAEPPIVQNDIEALRAAMRPSTEEPTS